MVYRTILGMSMALWRLRKRESWTRQQIQEHQARALQRVRTYAYRHSPFYRRFHEGLTTRPLQELPVLTKAMLYDHFDEIVTHPAVKRDAVAAHIHTLCGAERFLGRYIVNATSGTTGRPNFIVFDPAEWATVLASFTRYEHHIGSLWGAVQRPRMAVVASTRPWHMSARIGATVRSSWLPMLRIDVGDPLSSIVQRLNHWQPQILATYASMAGILADEQRAGRLRIAPVRIVCSAEVLTPELRQRIEAVWGKIVFNQYGASEGGTFAVECESHAGLHLFEDLVILEVVDQNNRPVPAGSYGDKILLTVLFNYTQPLIRYEISDILSLSPTPCPCGRAYALIDDIQGRSDEVLRYPTTTGSMGALHPMVFYRILDAERVNGWQVIQEQGALAIYLSGDPTLVNEPQLVESVRQAFARLEIVPPPIIIRWRQEVLRGSTGKASRILRAS